MNRPDKVDRKEVQTLIRQSLDEAIGAKARSSWCQENGSDYARFADCLTDKLTSFIGAAYMMFATYERQEKWEPQVIEELRQKINANAERWQEQQQQEFERLRKALVSQDYRIIAAQDAVQKLLQFYQEQSRPPTDALQQVIRSVGLIHAAALGYKGDTA